MKHICRTIFALLLATATVAAAQTASPAPKPATEAREKSADSNTVSGYRLEYSIYETEGGKRVNVRSYTMLLTDSNSNAKVRTGTRVPITLTSSPSRGNSDSPVTSVQYQDVGIMIDARVSHRDSAGSPVILTTNVEMSSLAPDQATQSATPIIRSSRAESTIVLTLKKPILLASIDDLLSKRSSQVEVTITPQ